MPGTKINQRVRAWTLARDCAQLGARTRTIHHLTGLHPKELQRLLFSAQNSPRGRAPDTREWYHNANLYERVESSIVVASFLRLRHLGFPSADALVSAYRYYQSVYPSPSRISFDRAFDLVANTEGRWIAKQSSFQLSTCSRCGSEFLDAIAGKNTAARPCPFCQLLGLHERKQHSVPTLLELPPLAEDIVVHLTSVFGGTWNGDGETPSTSSPFPPAKH